MPEEGFLRRWARVKATGDDAAPEAPRVPAPRPPEPPAARQPVPAPVLGRWARAGDVDVLPASAASASAASADAAERTDVAAPPPAAIRPSPTLDDVARLTPESDYSVFVGQGVDKSVQRLALKKLFADPHFNVMDRLDMYMDDYNIPSPVSEAMLAQLDHARSALRRFVEEDPAPAEVEARHDTAQGPKSDHDAAPAESLADDGACQAPPQEHGQSHCPNQQSLQGQA